MAIPTVPGTEMVNAQAIGTKLDLGALNVSNQAKIGLARAQGEFAGAIGQVGEMVGQFGEKMQAAKNFSIMAEADTKMRQKTADFQSSLQGRTDEDHWVEDWKNQATALQQEIYAKHKVAPVVKKQLEQSFANWTQANAIEFNTIANKQKVKLYNERIDMNAQELAKSVGEDSEEHISNLYSQAVQQKMLFPEQAEEKEKYYLNKMDEYAANNSIEANPTKAVEFLENKAKFPRLDPIQRNRLITEARRKRDNRQTDNFNNVLEMEDSGEQYHTDDQLREMAKNGDISARHAQTFIDTRWRKAEAATKTDEMERKKAEVQLIQEDKASSGRLVSLLTANNLWEANADEAKKDAYEIAASITDDTKRQQAQNRIDNHYDAVKKGKQRPVETEIYSRIRKGFEEGFLLPGLTIPGGPLGENKDGNAVLPGQQSEIEVPAYVPEKERKSWQAKQSEEVRNEAYRKLDEVTQQMQAWFDAQKPNDPQLREKAETERQRLMRPYVLKQVGDAINKNQGVAPPDQKEAAKSGVYKSAEDVRAAYKAGTIKKDEAADILRQQFGHQ